MPTCRNCNAPIFFLTEEPADVRVGGSWPARFIRTEPKPHPIDVDPSPGGTISLYEVPSRSSAFVTHGGYKGPFKMYYRRQYAHTLELLRRWNVPLFTSHFETCPAPYRRRS